MKAMKIVVAPDGFAGTMSALTVARALEAGWRTERPNDDLDLLPLSDGGPGFVECLRAALPGTVTTHDVTGPLGEPVRAQLLRAADGACYVESAMANGLHLVPPQARDPLRATTFGVGELIRAAVAAGSTRVVVGLGGSATNDGGAGLLAALGAVAVAADGRDATAALAEGPAGLARVAAVDLAGVPATLAGVGVDVATDVDNPLLGPQGASHGFARQKGADPAAIEALEAAMARWDGLCRAAGAPAGTAGAPGAGAAGGLGYGLLVAGGRRVSGIDTVVAAVDLPGRCAGAAVVVTGEGKFDWQSLHGKVVSGVAAAARASGAPGPPVVVVCGQAEVTEDQWRAAGISAVESLVAVAGSVEAAMADGPALIARIGVDLARNMA